MYLIDNNVNRQRGAKEKKLSNCIVGLFSPSPESTNLQSYLLCNIWLFMFAAFCGIYIDHVLVQFIVNVKVIRS